MFARKPAAADFPLSKGALTPPEIPARASPPAVPAARASEASRIEKPAFEEGLVVIGKGARINGRISDCRVLDVHGIVEADVVTEKLVVREGGGIKGIVQTDNAEVHGVIEGTLTVHEYLDIRRTAQVTGDVEYRRLAIEAGAQIRGGIVCSEPDASVAAVAASNAAEVHMERVEARRHPEPNDVATAQYNGTHHNGAEHLGKPSFGGGGHPNLQSFMPIEIPPHGQDKGWRHTH